MKVNLYDMFGDNFIIQLAKEARDAKITEKYVVIDDDKLARVLKMVAEIAKEREKRQNDEKVNILALSDNDRMNGWHDTLSCYGYNEDAPLSEIFQNFQPKEECEKVTATSFIKPDRYEKDKAGKKVRVEPNYIILATAGLILTRISTLYYKKNEIYGVHIFSPEGGILYSLNKKLKGWVPGIKPEVAFSLWITKKILDIASSDVSVNYINTYIVADASRSTPTQIRAGFTIQINKILAKAHLLTDTLERIVAKALNDNEENRNYYIRLTNYIYEYITGSKNINDVLYFANRDILSADNNELKDIMYYVNKILYNESMKML